MRRATRSATSALRACSGVRVAAMPSTSRWTSPRVSAPIGTPPIAGTISVRSCSSYLRTTEGLYGVPVFVLTAPLTIPRARARAASSTVATRGGGGGAGDGSIPRSTIPSSASTRQASAAESVVNDRLTSAPFLRTRTR